MSKTISEIPAITRIVPDSKTISTFHRPYDTPGVLWRIYKCEFPVDSEKLFEEIINLPFKVVPVDRNSKPILDSNHHRSLDVVARYGWRPGLPAKSEVVMDVNTRGGPIEIVYDTSSELYSKIRNLRTNRDYSDFIYGKAHVRINHGRPRFLF